MQNFDDYYYIDDKKEQKESLVSSLIQECEVSGPKSRLSARLIKQLEALSNIERKEIVSLEPHGCAPLFLASKNKAAHIAEYLILKCGAPLEQRGLMMEEEVRHIVTPLWCASVSGNLEVVRVLLKYGANVDAVSDSGSTALRSLCFIIRPGVDTSHMDIARALVAAGANIHIANNSGGTCLINSIKSPDLVRFLISEGADVNAEDVHWRTALHLAIQEHRLDTVRILVEAGADLNKKSKYGDDALQTACIKRALAIFTFLQEVHDYPLERVCDAYDLMGASYHFETNDISASQFFWRRSIELRDTNKGEEVQKPNLGPHRLFGLEEFKTEEELDGFLFDVNAMQNMRIQSLLITERVLGCLNKETIFRYMHTGAVYAEMGKYRDCIRIWNYALGLKIMKETILSLNTSLSLRGLIQLYLDLILRYIETGGQAGVILSQKIFLLKVHIDSNILDSILE